MGNLTFSISGKNANSTRLDIKARQFKFIADEDASFGGLDEGPNPLEYLLAGYASCLNVVAHLVAKERNINLRGLEITITGNDLNPAKVMGQPTADRTGFQSLDVQFEVDSDADQATLDSWITEVRGRCPVGDNLANPTPIKISVNQLVEAN